MNGIVSARTARVRLSKKVVEITCKTGELAMRTETGRKGEVTVVVDVALVRREARHAVDALILDGADLCERVEKGEDDRQRENDKARVAC